MSVWFFGSFFRHKVWRCVGAWGCRVNAAHFSLLSRMHKMTNNGSYNKGCDLRVCFIALTYLIAKRGLSLIEPLICLKGMKAGKRERELERVRKNLLSLSEKRNRSNSGFRFPGVSSSMPPKQYRLFWFLLWWELFCLWHSNWNQIFAHWPPSKSP